MCNAAIEQHSCPIASTPVDNAAQGVATKVCKRLCGLAWLSRDPGNSMDLLSKDVCQTSVVKRVIDEAKEVQDFVKIDQIDSIRLEACEGGNLDSMWTDVAM